MRESRTLYIGNLSFYTSEEQVFDLFSKCGEIKRIIMGLDRIKKTPCGFCFVEYFTRADAEKSVHYLCDTKLDERTIRVDYDTGFEEGRQYGRGKSGGQVRDEHRIDYDPGRGGYGKGVSGPPMSGMDMWGADANAPPLVPQDGPPRFDYYDGPRRGRGRGRGRRGGRGRHFHAPRQGGPDGFGPPNDRFHGPSMRPPYGGPPFSGPRRPPYHRPPSVGRKRSHDDFAGEDPTPKRHRSDSHDNQQEFPGGGQIQPQQQPVGSTGDDSR